MGGATMNFNLYERAYMLCLKFNHLAIASDLACMTETEVVGVIIFLLNHSGVK